jgi:hypothetical protein
MNHDLSSESVILEMNRNIGLTLCLHTAQCEERADYTTSWVTGEL